MAKTVRDIVSKRLSRESNEHAKKLVDSGQYEYVSKSEWKARNHTQSEGSK